MSGKSIKRKKLKHCEATREHEPSGQAELGVDATAEEKMLPR